MNRKTFSWLLLPMVSMLLLTGCDLIELFAPTPPAETPDPEPPVTIEEMYDVVIEFEDTTGSHNYIHPHASIMKAQWVESCSFDDLNNFCDEDRPLPMLEIEMLNDGNADITYILGRVEVWGRDGTMITAGNWFERTFNAKDGQVNVWQMRETISVEVDVKTLCLEAARPACAASNYTTGNVEKVVLNLEGVEIVGSN